MIRVASVGSVLSLSVLLIACQSNDKSTVVDEDAFARSMLINEADFPDGWFEVAGERFRGVDNSGGLLERCSVDAGRLGLALSPQFHTGPDTATISETLSVFVSDDAALDAFGRQNQVAACITEALNDGDFDDSELVVANARFERVWPDMLGGMDPVFLLRADGQFPDEDLEFPVYVLLLRGSRGRVGYSLVMQLSVAPRVETRGVFESVASAAVARLLDAGQSNEAGE